MVRDIGKTAEKGEAELNDLSYEDALLDAQMRAFFQVEYGTEEPPRTVLPRLARAIRVHDQGQREPQSTGTSRAASSAKRLATRLAGAMLHLYGASSHAGMSRVVSGSLAAMLLIITMWPNMMQALSRPAGVDNAEIGDIGYTTGIAVVHDRVFRMTDEASDEQGADALGEGRISTQRQQPILDDAHDFRRRALLEQKTGESLQGAGAGKDHLSSQPERAEQNVTSPAERPPQITKGHE